MASNTPDLLYFNGLNASTGEYLVPPLMPDELVSAIRGDKIDPDHRIDLEDRTFHKESHFGVKEGVDPTNIAQAGWGVIFAADADPAVQDALRPLLDWRKAQANQIKERYHEYDGELAYQPEESKNDYLARLGGGPGAVDPDVIPYYLLIVGDPEKIPYAFQVQLDVAYAVGRIHFDRVEDYAFYAESVVRAEKQNLQLARSATFFGAANPGDGATNLSAAHLIAPLYDRVQAQYPGWSVQKVVGEGASKARLSHLMGGDETPALLFTASHGLGFDPTDPRQLTQQGALVCQDWPGPEASGPVSPNWYFSGEDVASDAHVWGTIAFCFACFGAGTPRFDDYAHLKQGNREPAQIASQAFIANLPRKLLAHPKGGALAVLGHVERAWGTSFMWDRAGEQVATFESVIKRLLNGKPVGCAMEDLNQRYAEISTDLTQSLESIRNRKKVNPLTVSNLWTANNDARGYAIIGDPAVRLATEATAPATRPVMAQIDLSHLRTTAQPSPAASAEKPADAAPAKVATPPHATTNTTSSTVPPATMTATIPAVPSSSGQATDYGLFDSDTFKQAQGKLMAAMQQFGERVGAELQEALDSASHLDVETYVSDDLAGVDYKDGKFIGNARLRAVTRIGLTGNTLVCVPESNGELDRELWKIHLDMVQQAQANRAEFIKTLVTAATGLLGAFKGG
ncbi:MAG: hypothetical protein WCF84_06470 [Anaerolineae bacterium]